MKSFKSRFKRQEDPGQEQLRNWCAENWPELYRYVYRRVGNREEAQDITQETYARILHKHFAGEELGEELPSAGYLKTVALNIVRDRWRQTRSRGTLLPLEEALLVGQSEELALDKPLIEELMGRLSEEQRLVLQLRIIDGYSRAETARKMKRSEDSVRGLQYRAVKNLRELMLQELAKRR